MKVNKDADVLLIGECHPDEIVSFSLAIECLLNTERAELKSRLVGASKYSPLRLFRWAKYRKEFFEFDRFLEYCRKEGISKKYRVAASEIRNMQKEAILYYKPSCIFSEVYRRDLELIARELGAEFRVFFFPPELREQVYRKLLAFDLESLMKSTNFQKYDNLIAAQLALNVGTNSKTAGIIGEGHLDTAKARLDTLGLSYDILKTTF